jgi:hypothetical protein
MYNLLQAWIQQCVECHGEVCSESLSGEYINEDTVRLPRLVLDVGPPDSSDDLRLVETNGMLGKYIVLSHCWGPPDKRPLETRKENIQQHLRKIGYHFLPKTFKDAVTVTKALGLRFLWIDSLCIIQDDKDDWDLQAENMGQIYQNAYLALGASHAENSTVGLFVERVENFFSVEVPYITESGEIAGSFFIRPSTRLEYVQAITPGLGPLSNRAWCLQELLLSRRFIFFTKGGLVWCCKTHEFTETWHPVRNSIRKSLSVPASNWISIVEQYSSRSLTRQEDRLMALKGLANETQKTRPEDIYVFGMWLRDLPHQLLWYGDGENYEERAKAPLSLGIPSWSWAYRIGRVRFLRIFSEERIFFTAPAWFSKSETLVIIAPTEYLTYCEGNFPDDDRGFRGRLRVLPVDWNRPGNDFKQLFGLSTREPFDEIMAFICPTPSFSICGFHVRSTSLITGRDNEIVGFCTLDANPLSESFREHKLYICAPTIAMQCGRPGWDVFYVLILELMHDVESHSDDINDKPVWVRAGVGFIISDSWFLRKGVEGGGLDCKEINVVSQDSSRYGEVFYPFICNTEGNST